MAQPTAIIAVSSRLLVHVTVIGMALLMLTSLPAHALQRFRIGTGGSTGVYYPIGKLIALAITETAKDPESPLHGYVGIAQNSAGSIENARAVVLGELEAGLVQADIAAFALSGEQDFATVPDAGKLRAIACLYPEKFQMVVRTDAGIASFLDLRSKRISVDEPGSGTRQVTGIVLAAHGMTEDDLKPQYLKPAFTEDRMRNGQLDGFSMMAGVPMTAVTTMLPVGIQLLPIAPEIAARINAAYPHLFPGVIDAGTYPGISETPTIEVYALFVVSSDLPEAIAYALTETLFSPKTSDLLQQGHPQGKQITIDTARNGLTIPLHPGAERFFSATQKGGR